MSWRAAGPAISGCSSTAARSPRATASPPTTLSDVNIARENGGQRYLNARMDEVRISNVARSTNWLWATYLNIASNNAFNSHGPVTAIGNANVPPVLSTIGNQTANELSLFTFTATATDADPTAQTLTFSLDPGAPAGASLTTNGVFTWTPTEAARAGHLSR